MLTERQKVENKSQIFDLLKKHQSEIASFGAARLGLFGSYVRNQQKETSDIDLLVEFQQGKKTFKNLVHLSYYLQDLLKHKVQLVTWMGLADFVKKEVAKEIEYVAITD
jgi:uncharacterized protein